MKCNNCGKELYSLEVNMFKADGSDDWYDAEIIAEDNVSACINVLPNWTGMGLSEEEQTETIRCPRCRKFPLRNKYVNAYETVEVVLFKSWEDEKSVEREEE